MINHKASCTNPGRHSSLRYSRSISQYRMTESSPNGCISVTQPGYKNSIPERHSSFPPQYPLEDTPTHFQCFYRKVISISATLASVALPFECTHPSLLPNPHCPILSSSSQTYLWQSTVTFITTSTPLLFLSSIFLNKIVKNQSIMVS